MRDWLSHRVAASPDATALIRAEDGEAWTYADLDRLVAETAGRLAARGIGEGDHLGVLMPPYVGYVGLVHAAMRVGATLVPLGERLTPRELSARVDRADLSVLVCAESTESDAVAATDDVPVLSVDEPTEPSVAGLHDVEPEPVQPPSWSDDDRCCLLFTSGTTGEPKPVELTAGNLYTSAVASAFRLGVDPDDRWLVCLSLHHMGGLAPIYRSTLYGTTVVLREGFDPGGTADDIDSYDVTGISLVPTMLKRTLDRRGTLADSLRVVLLGGAPAPDELIERCQNYSVPVYPTYGMTEAASQVATATPREATDRLGTVGRPLFGTDITVVDDAGVPVERGETGEIVVNGPTITPGYYGDPETTTDAFGEYGLHTGDIGTLDADGYLHVLNRRDDRIITGGENVEPGEVAGVLRDHRRVTDAAVVGLSDPEWGERVAALVVPDGPVRTVSDDVETTAEREDLDKEAETEAETEKADENSDEAAEEHDEEPTTSTAEDEETDADPTATEDRTAVKAADPGDEILLEDDLFAFLRDRLAGFKLPRTVAFAGELPRTVSGTVDREAVREILRRDGHEPPRPDEGEFDAAGFEPAEPEPAREPDTVEDRGGSDEQEVPDDGDGSTNGDGPADGGTLDDGDVPIEQAEPDDAGTAADSSGDQTSEQRERGEDA